MTLSATSLNRTLLARQLLLTRTRLPIGRALERVGGLQAQYAPSPYVRLWSMLDGFSRDDLTRALERRRAVQGTLMRSTIHLVSARDYWRFEAGIGPSRREWWLRTWGRHELAENVDFVARELEGRLAGRTWHRKEIDALRSEKSAPGWSGMWIPLVRVPPSGHLGAPPRRPVPARRGVAAARARHGGRGARAPAPPLPGRVRAVHPERCGHVGRRRTSVAPPRRRADAPADTP